MTLVRQLKKYKVLQTISYPDPQLGTVAIEAGDVLEECIDSPGYFSNGIVLVTQGNIDHRVGEYFELITPIIKLPKVKKLTMKEKFLKKFPHKRLKG